MHCQASLTALSEISRTPGFGRSAKTFKRRRLITSQLHIQADPRILNIAFSVCSFALNALSSDR